MSDDDKTPGPEPFPLVPPPPPGAAVVNYGFGFIKEANVTSEDISVRDASILIDKVTPPDHLSIAHYAHLAKMTWVFKGNPVRWTCYDPLLADHPDRPAKHRARVIPEKLHSPAFFTASFKQDYTYMDTEKHVPKTAHRWLHQTTSTLKEAFDWLESRWAENASAQVETELGS